MVITYITIALSILYIVHDFTILFFAFYNKKTNNMNMKERIKRLIPSIRIIHWILGSLVVIFLILSRIVGA